MGHRIQRDYRREAVQHLCPKCEHYKEPYCYWQQPTPPPCWEIADMVESRRARERRQHDALWRRLIIEQGRRCGICTNDMQNKSGGAYRIGDHKLIVCRSCWWLHNAVKNRSRFVMDRILELVRKGYIGNEPQNEKKE